jgi:hypothetical protein
VEDPERHPHMVCLQAAKADKAVGSEELFHPRVGGAVCPYAGEERGHDPSGGRD